VVMVELWWWWPSCGGSGLAAEVVKLWLGFGGGCGGGSGRAVVKVELWR